ncbi:MAG: phenylalanine--tRNA ligase beta subunit-related protein [Thermomicrobiales bacterium]
MLFQHSQEIWRDFPELVPGVIAVDGIASDTMVDERIEKYSRLASGRLAHATESELPEIRAWRQTFSRMGLKPTQYRCASESLLRRFRKEGSLPRIHPLIDLCNAVSLAYAIPIAVFDRSRINGSLKVCRATGNERYETFAGDTEHPEQGEVIFADDDGSAHARRWTNRQSGASAIRDSTREILIVAEAMHPTAAEDVPRLIADLATELGTLWPTTPTTAMLTRESPRFEPPAS